MGIAVDDLSKSFSGEKGPALNHLSCKLPEGKINGIVGPDASGKTTLLRILAGLMFPTQGDCRILGINPVSDQKKLHEMIGYMPQRFGLYEDLSVKQNLFLYSDLQGIPKDSEKLRRLLSFAGLESFQSTLAGDLSGGMKQKLGLICSLLKKPKVLILDEPTVGVDPLSRRELWEMIEKLKEQHVTIVWSTSYLDEAEKCDYILLLNQGKVLFEGDASQLSERLVGRTFLVRGLGSEKRKILDRALEDANVLDAMIQGNSVRLVLKKADQMPLFAPETVKKVKPRFEDAFISLLGGAHRTRKIHLKHPPVVQERKEKTIVIENLTKKFGTLIAVNDLSLEIYKGEIFGLIGPNGAGKSTTFKILLGLLSPTSGQTHVAGISMEHATSLARSKIGYMAQKFALYDNMTMIQNLNFFAGVYPIKKRERKQVIEKMIALFELGDFLNHLTASLPLGIKQRLALSCSLMHEPQVLFLDEPTSGVDPLTRREFWYHINTLAEQGVTVMVSTHFMEEAEYCDRIGLIHKGKLRALDTADKIKESVISLQLPEPDLEDAFIQICEGG